MKRNLTALLILLALIGTGARLLQPQRVTLYFEDDEGNYRDGYAEPGVGYLAVEFEKTIEGRFLVDGRPAELSQVPTTVRDLLRKRLKSYNAATGQIEDNSTGNERAGDEFLGLDDRLVADLTKWRDSGRPPEPVR